MKRTIKIFLAAALALSLAACAPAAQKPDAPDTDNAPQGDFCPGKQIGPEGAPMARPAGFDPDEDMSFTTTDVAGNEVTNEIFAGSDRGVWVLFWRTDSDKSAPELEKLNGLTNEAAKHGYKILGVVMDGQENREKAAAMIDGLSFDNIIWNDSMAQRFEGIETFFTEEFFEENSKDMQGWDAIPGVKDPVSAYTNSRGQIQGPAYLVSLSEEKLTRFWEKNNSNATYEELLEESDKILKGD